MQYIKGIGAFIVKTDETHNREIKKDNGETYKGLDGKELILSPIFDDYENQKDRAEVVASIPNSKVPIGATLFFSKQILRVHKYGTNYHLGEGYYYVPYSTSGRFDHHQLTYGYEYKGEVKPFKDWVFVTPIKETKVNNSTIYTLEDDKFVEGKATVGYSPTKDLVKGDIVYFKKGLENPLYIQDKLHYVIFLDDILAKS